MRNYNFVGTTLYSWNVHKKRSIRIKNIFRHFVCNLYFLIYLIVLYENNFRLFRFSINRWRGTFSGCMEMKSQSTILNTSDFQMYGNVSLKLIKFRKITRNLHTTWKLIKLINCHLFVNCAIVSGHSDSESRFKKKCERRLAAWVGSASV